MDVCVENSPLAQTSARNKAERNRRCCSGHVPTLYDSRKPEPNALLLAPSISFLVGRRRSIRERTPYRFARLPLPAGVSAFLGGSAGKRDPTATGPLSPGPQAPDTHHRQGRVSASLGGPSLRGLPQNSPSITWMAKQQQVPIRNFSGITSCYAAMTAAARSHFATGARSQFATDCAMMRQFDNHRFGRRPDQAFNMT